MRRSNPFAVAVLSFLMGVVVAAVAVPNYGNRGDGPAPVASAGISPGETAGGLGDEPADGLAAGAVDDATTADGSPSSAGSAGTSGAASQGVTAQGTSGGGVESVGTPAASGSPSAARNSFRGVTDNTVKIGIPTLDASNAAAICPRCSTGDAAKGAAHEALLKAWRRDGLLPVHGRDITPVMYNYDPLSPEEARAACVRLAQEDKIFAALEVNLTTSECLAKEYKIPVITNAGTTEAQLRGFDGYVHNTWASQDRRMRNFPYFLRDNGFLKPDTVIGIYAQQGFGALLEPELRKMGFKVAANLVYEPGSTAASDPVAVQRFRSAGVNVAIIPWYIGEPAGFQNAAEAQGYRPKYPTVGTGADALADVFYNADAQDGNIAMDDVYLGVTSRKPASVSSKAGQYCLKEYQAHTRRALDAYDNDTELRFVLATCEMLEVLRQALVTAGPNLTDRTLLQGIQSIKGMTTSYRLSQTFGPRFDGSDGWTKVVFRKDRSCRPAPIKWCEAGGPQKYWVP